MTDCRICLGTEDGLIILALAARGDVAVLTHGLRGNAVRGIAIDPRDPSRLLVGCGLRGWGLHRSDDGGQTFLALGFKDRWVWDVVFDPVSEGEILVGVEPPMLYRGRAAGGDFRPYAAIDDLPSRERWMFFHPPFRAGHIHGIALSAERPERIVAGVEHGALIVSQDGGKTWSDALTGGDLHRVVVDPVDPDTIWAGAGDGLYRSRDGAESWQRVDSFGKRYVHGIVFDPFDPARVMVYVDSGRCPLYKSIDGGVTWIESGSGLPAAKPADPLRFHPKTPETLIYAGDDEGGSRLFLSRDAGISWNRAGPPLPKVWRMQVDTGIDVTHAESAS